MECPVCQTKVGSGEYRCRSCGASLASFATTVATPQPPLPQPRYLDFPPGAIFASRYIIIERTGQGGMGVVYKAIDTALDTVVALKLIRPDYALQHSFLDAFRREVRLTRQITHPNVCRVHDIGEEQGVLYLSMEWIQGETLRQLLNHAGPLDPERAFEIAEKSLLALEAAHAKGIVHRDLKPENIMIDDAGSIMVMDFGLAIDQTPGQEPAPGIAAGTPAYMSPEQRRGETGDARSDLYALGLVLSEMISGRMPDATSGAAPPLPSALGRRAASLIERFLGASKESRWGSAREAIEAIRCVRGQLSGPRGPMPAPAAPASRIRRALLWAGGGAALLAAAILLATILRPPSNPAGIGAAPPAGGDAEATASRAAIAARASPGWADFQMGVEYLSKDSDDLKGVEKAQLMLHRAIEADPNLVEAWATLVSASWVRYELSGQPAVKQKAEETSRRLGSILQQNPGGPPIPEVLCAEGIGQYVAGDLKAARLALEGAVKQDPAYDFAWARLGAARSRDNYSGAVSAAKTAIRLRPDSPLYLIVLGLIHDRSAIYDAAAVAFKAAIELKPDSRMAWNNLGTTYLRRGLPSLAIPAFLRALEIEETASTRSNLATAYYQQKDYEAAIANYRRAVKLTPHDPRLWGNLGDAWQMAGRKSSARDAYARAAGEAREALASRPPTASAHEELGLYCARAGDALCAIEEATRADQIQPRSTEIFFTNAIIRAILNRPSEALDWLERAVNLGLTKAEITNEPAFRPLGNDPRYKKIVALAR